MRECPDNYDAFEWYEREQERMRKHFRDWDDDCDEEDDFEDEEDETLESNEKRTFGFFQKKTEELEEDDEAFLKSILGG